MSEPKVEYYQTMSPIGKPILDILGVEACGSCIETIYKLEREYKWSFNLLTAVKYLWRLGQKSEEITSDLTKAIDYLTWAVEDFYRQKMGRYLIIRALDECRNLMQKIKTNIKTNTIKIIKLNKFAQVPEYAHIGDSGADLRSTERVEIPAGGRALVSTGLAIDLPIGLEAQIRSRSGLSWNYALVVLNSPGTIDSCFKGEIKVILINLGTLDFMVYPGDRIAQLVIAPVINNAQFDVVESINSDSARGANGFGSTGV